MANQKISQMPVATTPLAGTELIELVQSGVNVQSTATAIAALAPTPTTLSLIGNPNQTPAQFAAAGFASQTIWFAMFSQIGGGYGGTGNAGSSGWVINSGTNTNQTLNAGGANIATATQMGLVTSAAGANSAADITNNNPAVNMIRGMANGLPIAGFTMTLYFAFTTAVATEQCFLGYARGSGGYPGTQVPSTITDMIGLARDTADTNLQFMINNGAGTASKTDLGVTLASLAGKMLRLVITCDNVGNCAIALSNMESGGLSYSVSYPTATVKLPSVGASVQYAPRFHCNNGGTAAAVAFGISAGYFTVGFAGL
jgi:hypothetical protein